MAAPARAPARRKESHPDRSGGTDDTRPRQPPELTHRRAQRWRIVATLAALPDGDALSVTRLQDMLRLTPGMRVGDADRDAAAAALCEHFAQGRLTLDELNARLDATLTAATHGELSQVARDLPDLTALSARVGGLSRRKRARPLTP